MRVTLPRISILIWRSRAVESVQINCLEPVCTEVRPTTLVQRFWNYVYMTPSYTKTVNWVM
jgi:hypothetical protein